jgi:hypothetical protein
LAFNQIKKQEIKSVKTENDSAVNILVAAFLNKHYFEFYKQGDLDKIEEFQLSILRNVAWDTMELKFVKMIFSMLENTEVDSELGICLKSVIINKLNKILDSIDDEFDMETLKGIEDKFQFNIISVLTENDELESLKNCIERIYENLADDYFDLNTSKIYEETEFNKEVDNIWKIQHELSLKYFNDMDLDFDYNPIQERGFDKIFDDNVESKFDSSNDWSEYEKSHKKESFESEVEMLFNRFENR